MSAAASETRPKLVVKPAEWSDIRHAVGQGLQDFSKRPLMGIFFGAVYAIGGLIIFFQLFYSGAPWLIIPLAIGFPLIGPFIAAGLYDISRRLEKAETFSFGDVLQIVFKQRQREFGWMAFTVLFVFWIWMYQVRLLLALFLSKLSFSSMEGLTQAVFFTTNGWLFLGVGTLVGALLSVVLFSITVIAMPLLLDQEVDFVTAMITSVKTVFASPFVMICCGIAIAAVAIASMIPAFLGLILSLPILGHATWHLYRRLISIE